MKTLAIIGSTGSIGKSALKVYNNNKKNFKLVSLAANTNLIKLKKQYLKFKPKNIFLIKNNGTQKIENKNYFTTKDIFLKKNKKIDYVISGVSGYDAININFELTKVSKKLLIANKETIVCGGKVFLDFAKKNKCEILPIDSEHHCIDLFFKSFKLKKDIKKIYLTASGGPFLNKKIKYDEKLNKVVDHPNWKMGKKISTDSATLMNKVFEVIEAKKIFNIDLNKFNILIHPKSYIHAIIKFKNGLIKLVAHDTDMRIPIFNSIYCDDYNHFKSKKINIKLLNNLNLNKVDPKKYPLVNILKIIPKKDTLFETLLVSINDELVSLFLHNKISFEDISNKLNQIITHKIFLKYRHKKLQNLTQIEKLNEFVRLKTKSLSVISKFR